MHTLFLILISSHPALTPPKPPPRFPLRSAYYFFPSSSIYQSYHMKMEHSLFPPGFRFHPTDEELITHYLCPKLLHPSFSPLAIADADFNNSEPWDLPCRAKMGGREWYFFCLRDRKYPTGSRANRATPAGYWKATGKDKHIFNICNTLLIGMKKTLVFYTGRAPRGGKTNWVMHEYRSTRTSSSHSKNEWVLCRVFLKNAGGKRTIAGASSELPPLTDASPNQAEFGESSHSHVTCFSLPNHPPEDPIMNRDDIVDSSNNHYSPSHTFVGQDQGMMMMGNGGWGDVDGDISSLIYNTHDMIHRSSSHNQQYYSSASAGPVDDIGCLWNYST